ncbi:hypothetical protein GCM10022236_34720 [Microlunatus ginsengisoli]|uniref:Methyltransferase type 11 domain-containing protein n=1 Tax=Microlunatus ginsengisoli TaxID=363863 RepID=A0ABP7ACR9_9ACTN
MVAGGGTGRAVVVTGAPTRPGRSAYAGGAERWHSDAALVYAPLAEHLIARSPLAPGGIRALDVGTGTGVAADALRAAGAAVVGADLEPDMARFAARRGPALVADVARLPFADAGFDLVVAAFVVNHLADPAAGLGELRRVTRAGGAVLCSVFSVDRSAAKAAVDRVALRYGYHPPDWYRQVKVYADRVGTSAALAAAARTAGFAEVEVSCQPVDVGLADPALVVRARLGMPQLRTWFDSLDARRRASLVGEATEAVRETGERFAPEVIEAVLRPRSPVRISRAGDGPLV